MALLRMLAILTALAAVALLALAGPGTRLEWWDFRLGLTLVRYAAYAGVAGLVLSVLALVAPKARKGALVPLLLALVVSGAAFVVPYRLQQQARSLPPIHDITTDVVDPPAFVAVLPLRADAPNSAEYAGDSIAQLQQAAYPDIAPVQLDLAPSAALARAVEVARTMGWEIVDTDEAAGRLEATATTTWFGFKDDIVVRVRPEGSGSRLDIRSVSRVGRSDVGANAARIRAYVARLTAPAAD